MTKLLKKIFKKYKKINLETTNKLSKEIFSLPMYPAISDNQVEYVVNKIKEIL